MKIYLTSDTHFSHDREKIKRPEGFEESLLKSIKDNHGDLLIHCGDFCIGDDTENHLKFMTAAHRFRKKILVRGNHDNKSDAWYYARGWDFVCEMMWLRVFGKQIIFSHMPVYKSKNTPTENLYSPHFAPDFNIHGHLHGNNHHDGESNHLYDYNYFYDLAPELHNYKIVNLEAIISHLCKNQNASSAEGKKD